MYNSMNDAALAHLNTIATRYGVTPKYSDEVATTLKNIADIYELKLTDEEKAALSDTSGHYNAIADQLYHLLEVMDVIVAKTDETGEEEEEESQGTP